MNKIFPAVNLAFILTIALLATLLIRTWTHPPYPFRVDGSKLVGSPKNLQKLEVSKPPYNAGAVSRVVQANVFRKQRSQYIPPTPPPVALPAAPKPALPPPNLVLKGVLMLGGTKIAILQGEYSTLAGGKVTKKKVKKKGYSLGQVVGDFELTEIEKTWVILDDKKGRKIRLRLSTRSADKVIHREGTSLFQKDKKFDPRKTRATSTKHKPIRPKVKRVDKKAAPAPAPVFRVSGASSPPPARVHISGQ
ncbi:MAG: hypothetical protein ISR86_08200 [Nitrospinaceae bacterium]|nr:hypothetical protein [Nitrospinaceae bacterium]